ncbi:MAG: beta-galactosidase, partial [Thermoguttaceae bacterium]
MFQFKHQLMQQFKQFLVLCSFALLGVIFCTNLMSAQETVVRPNDTGAVLQNPGMGWTMHFYSNDPRNYGSKLEPSDSLDWFPGCSVVYLRLPWSYIEPEEGKFNWAILDTPAQRWIAKGKKVAFRFTCCESWLRWATPEWVVQSGAKGIEYEYGKGPREGGPLWAPIYDDPIFLEKLDKFLAAAAERYNGNPDVAFIDVGTFGMWGEGHTGFDCRLSKEETDRVSKIHIDLHTKHFPKTLLCVSDDISGHDSKAPWPGIEYALSQGVTLRDDSILVQKSPNHWFHSNMAEMFWHNFPV